MLRKCFKCGRLVSPSGEVPDDIPPGWRWMRYVASNPAVGTHMQLHCADCVAAAARGDVVIGRTLGLCSACGEPGELGVRECSLCNPTVPKTQGDPLADVKRLSDAVLEELRHVAMRSRDVGLHAVVLKLTEVMALVEEVAERRALDGSPLNSSVDAGKPGAITQAALSFSAKGQSGVYEKAPGVLAYALDGDDVSRVEWLEYMLDDGRLSPIDAAIVAEILLSPAEDSRRKGEPPSSSSAGEIEFYVNGRSYFRKPCNLSCREVIDMSEADAMRIDPLKLIVYYTRECSTVDTRVRLHDDVDIKQYMRFKVEIAP